MNFEKKNTFEEYWIRNKVIGRLEDICNYYYINFDFEPSYVYNHSTKYSSDSYAQENHILYKFFKDKKQCEDFGRKSRLALELLRKRDYFNGDWKADWNSLEQYKVCLINPNGEHISILNNKQIYEFSFKSKEALDNFLKNVDKEDLKFYMEF